MNLYIDGSYNQHSFNCGIDDVHRKIINTYRFPITTELGISYTWEISELKSTTMLFLEEGV
jgi:hypothetical protein